MGISLAQGFIHLEQIRSQYQKRICTFPIQTFQQNDIKRILDLVNYKIRLKRIWICYIELKENPPLGRVSLSFFHQITIIIYP
jgi:hypothetical protein